MSEIVTNAVVHSTAPHKTELSIALTHEGEFTAVEVWDRGAGFAWKPDHPDLTDTGGRGLLLVDRLAYRWGTGRAGGGSVWFLYRDPAVA
jgi:anti-sigma regulatory factor (Ser/Thr protein kinase)